MDEQKLKQLLSSTPAWNFGWWLKMNGGGSVTKEETQQQINILSRELGLNEEDAIFIANIILRLI